MPSLTALVTAFFQKNATILHKLNSFYLVQSPRLSITFRRGTKFQGPIWRLEEETKTELVSADTEV